MTVTIHQGDALTVLRTLPSASVQCCVTSPPYFGLRNYGVAGQIGLEDTAEEYVAKLVEVFREVWRVLRSDGVLFLNLGDSYNAAGREGHGTRIGYKQGTNRASANGSDSYRPSADNLKPKDLLGIPWRVAFALQADGWYLRSDIIWSKPNPMPESVTDRPTKAHEYIFLLSKSERYFYDAEAVREVATHEGETRKFSTPKKIGRALDGKLSSNELNGADVLICGRNLRSVWTSRPDYFKLRSDLSASDRAYVLGELLKRGLLDNKNNSGNGQSE